MVGLEDLLDPHHVAFTAREALLEQGQQVWGNLRLRRRAGVGLA